MLAESTHDSAPGLSISGLIRTNQGQAIRKAHLDKFEEKGKPREKRTQQGRVRDTTVKIKSSLNNAEVNHTVVDVSKRQGCPAERSKHKGPLSLVHGFTNTGKTGEANDNVKGSGVDGKHHGDFPREVHFLCNKGP